MPTYRDPETGTRYWFEAEPDWNLVRGDLALMTEEEATEAEAAAEEAPEGEG